MKNSAEHCVAGEEEIQQINASIHITPKAGPSELDARGLGEKGEIAAFQVSSY